MDTEEFDLASVVAQDEVQFYVTHPKTKKPTTWCAAAMPALTFASSVWAPDFFGVQKTRSAYFARSSACTGSLGATSAA